MSQIFTSLLSLISSRKAQAAAAGVVAVVLTRMLGKLGLTSEDINYISTAIIGGAMSLILGIAHEDAAGKSAPTQQVNLQSDVTNSPPAAPPVATAPVIAKAFDAANKGSTP